MFVVGGNSGINRRTYQEASKSRCLSFGGISKGQKPSRGVQQTCESLSLSSSLAL